MDELSDEVIIDRVLTGITNIVARLVDHGRRRMALEQARYHHDQGGFTTEDHSAETVATATTFYDFLKGSTA